MFHDIFKKLKFKKKSKKLKPKIIADIHEKNSLILSELKSNEEIELEIKPLKIGDYLIGQAIIERKTTNDFISSMLNKRLIEQIKQMQKYSQKLIIIEGKTNELFRKDTKLNPNAIRGFILSITMKENTPIILTKNYKETSKYLVILAKQQLKTNPSALHNRIPKTLKEQKQYILEAFPNIGPKKAGLLLNKFKNLKNIFNASEEELKIILKNNTKNFKDILDS